MAGGNDLLKYITERVVTYFDTPKDVRKQHKENSRMPKEPLEYRLFGLLPFVFHMWKERRKQKKEKTPPSS